jgi:hypothetical protein
VRHWKRPVSGAFDRRIASAYLWQWFDPTQAMVTIDRAVWSPGFAGSMSRFQSEEADMGNMINSQMKTTTGAAPRRWPLPARPLLIGGSVRTPLQLDFSALYKFADQVMLPLPVLSGHELVAVPLRDVLSLAGMTAHARSILVESDAGVTALSLDTIDRLGLVYRIGRAPLPYGFGGPFRILSWGRGAVEDIKYVSTLCVSDRRYAGAAHARGPSLVR